MINLAYKFEQRLSPVPRRMANETSMAALRRFAERIWRDEGCTKPLPRIFAGRGIRSEGGWTSCFMTGHYYIVLARQHRCRLILLHELCHAMGYYGHGWQFVRHMQYLLVRYCGYKRRWVNEAMRDE